MPNDLDPNGHAPAATPQTRGGFPLFEIVPWLMLATTMRFIGWQGGALSLVTHVIANLAVFLAFLLGAHAMIAWTGGELRLGRSEFSQQLKLGWRILHRILLLLIAMTLLVSWAGPRLGPHMMLGFDGIAFDQFTTLGRVWSATLAAILMLMVLQAEDGQPPALLGAIGDLAARWRYLLPVIAAIALMQMALNPLQALARDGVHALWTSGAPETVKNYVYFAFVSGFASVRLWVTLFILTLALRESYRAEMRAHLPAAKPSRDP